jgi:PDZ domain-containing secreted protein
MSIIFRILAMTAALATVGVGAALPAQENDAPTSRPDTRPKTAEESEQIATLGVETRAPTQEECLRYALELNVRYKGQMICRLNRNSVAAMAGLRRGDVILAFDKVEIFSSDDLRDLLSVRVPGQAVTLQVKRGKDKKKETLRLKLGDQKIPKRKEPRLVWQHAGLPYLEDALAQARREKKRVLVGLSGAET